MNVDDSLEPTPQPPARFPKLQFNLRTLMLFTLACGGVFGLLGMRLSKYRAQIQASEQLQASGAQVEWTPRNFPQFDAPTRVSLRGASLTDDDFRSLREMDELAWLCLAETSVTDEDMAKIAKFRRLQVLDLSNTQITDAGLESLEGLGLLNRLDMRNTRVTEQGAERFRAALPRLELIRSSPSSANQESNDE
ncbi:MAG: hypothetical protein N2C14_20855 [Planctomycetales bacterium]